jgi:DNA repair exonuclease SbcCD nuclease subunit/DNA repair exonuclease SbcCD ATPase subunit
LFYKTKILAKIEIKITIIQKHNKMRIAHIADLHIKEIRLDEYNKVFENFIKQMRELTPDIVAIVGDIFDRKIENTPLERECFYKLIDDIIALKIHVVMIPGNHDCNMNNKNVKDLIEVDIKAIYTKNEKSRDYVHYWNHTGVYHKIGIDWYVYSPSDQLRPTFNASKYPKIALIHESIRTAMLNNKTPVDSNARITPAELAQYDIVMLGDIHKRQHLAPNIAYCGSMLQQNWGESPDEHGFLLWNTETRTAQPFEVVNPKGVKLTLYFEDDKFTTYPTHVKAYDIIVKYKNCTPKFLEDAQIKIQKDMGLYVDRTHFKEHIVKVYNQPVQTPVNALTSWTKKTGMTPVQINCIRELGKKYNVEMMEDRVYVPFDITYMSWENLRCYKKKSHIDFSILTPHERIGIFGANRSGKSSVLDIIIFVLYGEVVRGLKGQIFTNGAKTYDARLYLTSGEDKYQLWKTGTRTGDDDENLKNNLQIIKNGQSISHSVLHENYAYLKTIFGTLTDFLTISCQLQDGAMFISKPYADQKKYLFAAIGMSSILDLNELVKNDKKDLVAKRKAYEEISVIDKPCPAADPLPDDKRTDKELENRIDYLKGTIGTIILDKCEPAVSKFEVKVLLSRRSELHEYTANSNKPIDNNLEILTDELQNYQVLNPRTRAIEMDKLKRLPQPIRGNLEKLRSYVTPDIKEYNGVITETLQELVDQDVSFVPEAENYSLEYINIQLRTLPPPIDGDIHYLEKQLHQIDVVAKTPICHAKSDTIDQLTKDMIDAKKYDAVSAKDLDAIKNELPTLPAATASHEELLISLRKDVTCEPPVAPTTRITDAQNKLSLFDAECAIRTNFKFAAECDSCQTNAALVIEKDVNYRTTLLANIAYDQQFAKYQTAEENKKFNADVNAQIRWIVLRKLEAQHSSYITSNKIRDIYQSKINSIKYDKYLTVLAHNANIQKKIDAAKAYYWVELIASQERNEQYKIVKSKINRLIAIAIQADEAYQIHQKLKNADRYDMCLKKISNIWCWRKYQIETELANAERAEAWTRYSNQQKDIAEHTTLETALLWRKHQVVKACINDYIARINDLDLYQRAISPTDGYPSYLLKNSIAKIRDRITKIVEHVIPDKLTISDEFEIKIKDVPIALASGFQKAIVNLALRCAMTKLGCVAHQRDTLYIDEGLLGSCDSTNISSLVDLLGKLEIRLFVISHNEQVKSMMTTTIHCRIDQPIQFGRCFPDPIITTARPFDHIKEKIPIKERAKRVPKQLTPEETKTKAVNKAIKQAEKNSPAHPHYCAICAKGYASANALTSHKTKKRHLEKALGGPKVLEGVKLLRA